MVNSGSCLMNASVKWKEMKDTSEKGRKEEGRKMETTHVHSVDHITVPSSCKTHISPGLVASPSMLADRRHVLQT